MGRPKSARRNKQSRDTKREQAKARAEARSARGPKDQLGVLAQRPGRAAKERARLRKLISS